MRRRTVTTTTPGPALWQPTDATIRDAAITRFAERVGRPFRDPQEGYAALWEWSVAETEAFWGAIAEAFEVRFHERADSVLAGTAMPGARWFPGATLNYAEHALRHRGDAIAIRAYDETGAERLLTRDELARAVGSAATWLRASGVGAGDRVAAYLPNGPEAVIALLATASLGAIWSSCSPDFGPGAVIDRLAQIEPTVLIAVDRYRYAGQVHDRRAALDAVVARLPSLRSVVVVASPSDERGERREGGEGGEGGVTWASWDALVAAPSEPSFAAVPFEHPLWILYSSGTTGLPKAIVHGHGGILLEHLKALGLHLDLRPDDRLFWFTTTGWMMWNFIVSGLALGMSIVLYDGSPSTPNLLGLWRVAERAGITYFGTSAPFVHASMKRRVVLREAGPLASVRAVGSTGAPLSPEAYAWLYEQLGPDLWLGSISGGTDLCTAFVGSCPTLPVHAGELQCRTLGAAVAAYDEAGRSVVDEVGELVIEAPMPSMPLFFWNDPAGHRYRESYFDVYPEVWRHGDWIEVTSRGTCRIFGRSDATLNRGGVRIGTAELYRIVDALPGVEASLAVDTSGPEGDGRLLLFVVPEEGHEVDEDLRAAILERIRTELSPRHVPDAIVQAPGIPMTLNGKRMEVPVKRLVLGAALHDVASPDALDDVSVLRWYADRGPQLRERSRRREL